MEKAKEKYISLWAGGVLHVKLLKTSIKKRTKQFTTIFLKIHLLRSSGLSNTASFCPLSIPTQVATYIEEFQK
jgi:hypothetical protein